MTEIYALTQPPQVETESSPPLLVLLHGFGSNERDLIGLAPHLDERLHIVSTRAPLDIGYGGYAWYYLYGVPPALQHDDASRAYSMEVLRAFLADLPGKIGADTRRVYLLGFSQGAVMALNLALTQPGMVAGVVAISGYLDEQVVPLVEPATLEHLHLLVMHGTQDDLIPVVRGRAMRDYLKTMPVQMAYHEYPTGHNIHPDALAVMRDWFAAQLGA